MDLGGTKYRIDPANQFNIACSGATTDAIDKKKFKTEDLQADQLAALAKKNSIKMIVLSIGGNDMNFSSKIKWCASAFHVWSPSCSVGYDKTLQSELHKTRENVDRVVATIRRTMKDANYVAGSYRLVIQSYPSPIPAGNEYRFAETIKDRDLGGCPFYNTDSTWVIDKLVPGIAEMLRGAAKKEVDGARADFLDTRNVLRHHEVCAKDPVGESTAGNTLQHQRPKATSEWARYIVTGAGHGEIQESLHPNYWGQEELRACLATMARATKKEFECAPPV